MDSAFLVWGKSFHLRLLLGLVLALLFFLVIIFSSPFAYGAEYTIEEGNSGGGGGGGSGGGSGGGGGGGGGGGSSLIVYSDNNANCSGDASGIVDIFDLSILLSNWGKVRGACDQNSDNNVNIFDLSILLSNWTNK